MNLNGNAPVETGHASLQAKAKEVGKQWSADAAQAKDREVNQSGLIPLGRAILVEPFEPERKKSAILLPDHVLKNERVLDVKVRCVEVGPGAFPDEPARCAAGDIVFVAKMSGFVAQGPRDGKPYRLVNDRDVFAKITWLTEQEQDHG